MWPLFETLRRTLAGPNRGSGPAADRDWSAPLLQLGLSDDELRALLTSRSLEPHFAYWRYRKPKSSGGWREIAEPDARLKGLQRRIVRRYLDAEPVHPAAVAYRPGQSTRDHAEPHAGAAVVVTADVTDFFPSTRAERVEDWWRGRVGAEAAEVLTWLTTDRGGLPQGAPTSPGLSNLVNAELDARVAARAAAAGARYTRYCDDLAFSWPRGSGLPSDFERAVRAVLHEYGYRLHPVKGWRVHDFRAEPEVTGVVLTRSGRLALPARIRDVMRRLARSADPRDAARLEGYRGYAAMILKRRKR